MERILDQVELESLDKNELMSQVRAMLESAPWAWFHEQVAQELAEATNDLSLPAGMRGKGKEPGITPDDYLRGKIRALNWALSLPNRAVVEYNYEVEQKLKEERKAPNEAVLGRRISPTPDDEMET